MVHFILLVRNGMVNVNDTVRKWKIYIIQPSRMTTLPWTWRQSRYLTP